MNLIKYLQDKRTFIITYLLNTMVFSVILYLTFYINNIPQAVGNIAYGVFLGSILLIVGLSMDYRRAKSFYSAIEESDDLNYIFNIEENISVEYELFRQILVNDYNAYMKLINSYKEELKLNRDFNNRWIHEMKTPLSVIKLILENEKEKNTNPESIGNFESIEEEIDKISRGLEMGLYNLRVKDFSIDFKVGELDLLKLVREVINEEKSNFIRNSIFPKINGQEGILVRTDKKWIKFVLSQILNNSIKYTRVKEVGPKEITIDIEKLEAGTSLIIRDTGVGIPMGDIHRIFNPFFTGTNGRKYSSSTGMGLYLSKYILDKLGHSVFIKSEEGEYTEIKILFREKSIYNLS